MSLFMAVLIKCCGYLSLQNTSFSRSHSSWKCDQSEDNRYARSSMVLIRLRWSLQTEKRLTANMDRLVIVGKQLEEHEPVSCTSLSMIRYYGMWQLPFQIIYFSHFRLTIVESQFHGGGMSFGTLFLPFTCYESHLVTHELLTSQTLFPLCLWKA